MRVLGYLGEATPSQLLKEVMTWTEDSAEHTKSRANNAQHMSDAPPFAILLKSQVRTLSLALILPLQPCAAVFFV